MPDILDIMKIDNRFLDDITDLYRRTPLMAFMHFCSESKKEGVVLDCGAGAKVPPLALFKMHGYETHGIDISEKKLGMAKEFENRHDITLNIKKGDMRQIEFKDDSFDFVYSYNTIFHMEKNEVYKSIGEMKRVLKPGGLMFFNLLSVDDDGYGKGTQKGEGEFGETYDGVDVLHSYFGDEEADKHLEGLGVIAKQKRAGKLNIGDHAKGYAFVDYFLAKAP